MQPSLLVDIQCALVTIAFITPRAFVCLSILPGFSLRTLTGLAKNAVAMAIALPAALPTFYFIQETPPGYLMAAILIFKEAAIGLLLGVVLAMPVWVVESIGSILDTQRSPIQLQSNNSSVDRDASLIGAILLQACIIMMIQAGLFVALARILIESYGAWPAFNLTPPFELGHFDILIKKFGELFWHMAVYGGPVLLPLILVDFTFAIIGVFASNLQVSFISSPIKSILGLFILLIYWPTFSHYIGDDFSHLLDFSAAMIHVNPRH